MAAIMAVGIHTTAFAETLQGGSDWKVEFNGSKMSSNFTSADMKKDIFQLQPGDTMELQVGLKNTSEKDADWYMTNEVLKSLEDSQSIAEGGAYGYKLTYVGPDKKETVLYDSETVGGEDAQKGEGLHQATDALEKYLYLDRLSKGDVASVHLTVKLDGETQGNDYQDTLASLQMSFAADPVTVTTVTKKGEDKVVNKTVTRTVQTPTKNVVRSPKTGDTTQILAISAVALAKRCDSSDSGSGTDQEAKRGEGRGSEMKKMYKIATVLLAFCFLLGSVPMSVKAEDYTYKVTIYSGKQGTFTGIPGNLVKENNATVSISDDKSAIVIDKLNPNDSVNMSELLTSVSLGSNSKYYVRGIKESGRDNSEKLNTLSFDVKEDQEYVVAYGIKGDQVAYTINYQDANGNKLADSQTFYGNVGDKPVVAYTYIDGYTPEYRNLTKTLSANAAENVFTFNYLPYETVTVTTPGQTITNTTEQTVTVPGGTTTTTGGTTGTTGGTTGTTGGTGTNANGGNAAGTTTGNGDAQQDTDATGGTGNGGPGNVTDNQGTEGTENGGTTQDAQGNEDTTTIGDEDTPKADQDLKDLDDEDVPKSDKDLDGNKEVKKSLPLVAGVGIGVAALAALAAGIVIVRKRVHR